MTLKSIVQLLKPRNRFPYYLLYSIIGWVFLQLTTFFEASGFVIVALLTIALTYVGIPLTLGILIYSFVKKISFTKNIFVRTQVSAMVLFLLIVFDPMPFGSYFLWFDKDTWKNENTWRVDSPTKRRLMTSSLYYFCLWNKTEDDVIEMLGESSGKFDTMKTEGKYSKILSYRIDNEDGVPIDSQWLVLFFDENKRLVDKGIYTD